MKPKLPAKDIPLNVLNAREATFECVYPSCGGICCKNGRPGISPGEARRIEGNLQKFLPHLSERARRRVTEQGFLTRRVKEGRRTLAVVDGWCVFFHDGCVLHKVGAAEGQRFAYKPWHCVAFPLEKDAVSGEWYVRQHGYRGEGWDLFCIDPAESRKRAMTTLAAEVEFAQGIERGDEDWRRIHERVDAPGRRPKRARRGPKGGKGARGRSR